jgi:hypothetical protein
VRMLVAEYTKRLPFKLLLRNVKNFMIPLHYYWYLVLAKTVNLLELKNLP